MVSTIPNREYAVFFFLLFVGLLVYPAAWATRLPQELNICLRKQFPDARIRIDASIETSRGELYLPLVPRTSTSKPKLELEASYPNGDTPDLLVYSNGWCFLRLNKKGSFQIATLPFGLSDKTRDRLLNSKFPSDLIVPENLVVARSLKSIVGDVAVAIVDDATINKPSFGQQPQMVAARNATKHGAIFVTSPGSGAITLLGENSMKKLADFPTEGTPSGMAYAGSRLYIADQTKSRILILDIKNRQFDGQIDLPRRSAPKGLAALPNGQLLYVSESATNSVAVIETATGKVLLRTKVPAGPARIAVTPNGNNLLVLDVPAGQLTIISTMNQKAIGSIKVGAMPSALVIARDNQLAFVSNRISNTVSIVDIGKRQVVGSLPTGNGPTGVALSSDNSQLFVANAKDNTIGIYDLKTRQKLKEVKLPIDIDFPSTLMLLPDGKRLLVTSASTDSIGVFDTTKLEFEEQPITIGHPSNELIWVPAN